MGRFRAVHLFFCVLSQFCPKTTYQESLRIIVMVWGTGEVTGIESEAKMLATNKEGWTQLQDACASTRPQHVWTGQRTSWGSHPLLPLCRPRELGSDCQALLFTELSYGQDLLWYSCCQNLWKIEIHLRVLQCSQVVLVYHKLPKNTKQTNKTHWDDKMSDLVGTNLLGS